MVLCMDRWAGKVAIVTGASAGIGAAIAEKLVEKGMIVAGLARRTELIETLSEKLSGKAGKLHAIKADIAKEEDILEAFKWVKDNLGPVHVLINNAGVLKNTTLYDGDTEAWRNVLNVNVLGLCICTREAIKVMQENQINGHVVHLNSVAGHGIANIPKLNVYPASKFAVTALTETLRQELNRICTKIKVTSVSPGYTVTEMTDGIKDATGDYVDLVSSLKGLQPEDIADSVIYALSTPEHVQVHELTIKPVGEPY